MDNEILLHIPVKITRKIRLLIQKCANDPRIQSSIKNRNVHLGGFIQTFWLLIMILYTSELSTPDFRITAMQKGCQSFQEAMELL